MLKRIVIARHERGLLIRNRSVQRVLAPGVYWFLNPGVSVIVIDTRTAEVVHPLVHALVDDSPVLCNDVFRVVALAEYEVGLVRERGNLVRVLSSGARYVFWAHYPELEIEVVDTRDEYRLTPGVASLVTRRNIEGAMASLIAPAEVATHNVGLLWVDGELVDTLNSGCARFLVVQPLRESGAV